jgi:hypothetical protein
MQLPNSEPAFIDIRKLTDYCLNLEHFEERHKARVFKSALDIDLDSVNKLQVALKEAAQNYQAIPTQYNQYGQKYVIDFMMHNGDKHAMVRIVTCYVL